MYKFLFGTTLTLLLVSSFAGAAGLTAQTGYPQEQCRSQRGGYCANLAGVGFADTAASQSNVDVGDTIAKFYTYGLSVVGLAALIMFVYAGILYMVAGENTGMTGQARKFMTNAIWGMILAFVSWLILFTINPDLVKKLSDLNLPDLSPVQEQSIAHKTTISAKDGELGGRCSDTGGVKISCKDSSQYCQPVAGQTFGICAQKQKTTPAGGFVDNKGTEGGPCFSAPQPFCIGGQGTFCTGGEIKQDVCGSKLSCTTGGLCIKDSQKSW